MQNFINGIVFYKINDSDEMIGHQKNPQTIGQFFIEKQAVEIFFFGD